MSVSKSSPFASERPVTPPIVALDADAHAPGSQGARSSAAADRSGEHGAGNRADPDDNISDNNISDNNISDNNISDNSISDHSLPDHSTSLDGEGAEDRDTLVELPPSRRDSAGPGREPSPTLIDAELEAPRTIPAPPAWAKDTE